MKEIQDIKAHSKNIIVKHVIITAAGTTLSLTCLSFLIWRVTTLDDPTGIKWRVVTIALGIFTLSALITINLTDLVKLIKKHRKEEKLT